MPSLRVAIYARVSSDPQAGGSIASQIAALEARVIQEGLRLEPDHRFIDDGYSGATLIRPALERLRDTIAAGAIDRLYVHSPDRLARRYAYQVLLIDEFQRAGIEVAFLNRPLGRSAEDDLLLQVQGMIAEYERAKILERSRRGKKHAANSGSVNVLAGAPYGYRYLDRHVGGGEARYEIIDDQAQVVRQIFHWVGVERSASARSAVGCGGPAIDPLRARRAGIGPPCGACSRTRPTRAPRRSARHGSVPCQPGCGQSEAVPSSHAARWGSTMFPRMNGSRYRFRRWSIAKCSRPCRRNWRRTAGAAGRARAASVSCCRV